MAALRKEIQTLRNEKVAAEKQVKNERKRNEYLERECSLLKEKNETLTGNALEFERASEALYQSHY